MQLLLDKISKVLRLTGVGVECWQHPLYVLSHSAKELLALRLIPEETETYRSPAISSKPHRKQGERTDLNTGQSKASLGAEGVEREYGLTEGTGIGGCPLGQECPKCHPGHLICNMQRGEMESLSRLCSLGKDSLARPRSASR